VSQHQFFINYWQVKTHGLLFKSSFFCVKSKRNDPCADFFTVRKTEETFTNMQSQGIPHKFIWKIFEGKNRFLFEVLSGVRKRAFVIVICGVKLMGGGDGGYALAFA